MPTQYTFTIPNLPKRFINAINAELYICEHHGHKHILTFYGHEMTEPIPAWLIIAWAESGMLMRVPNLGIKTINDVIEIIAKELKIKKPIVLRPTES